MNHSTAQPSQLSPQATEPVLYGLMAEFEDVGHLIHAARAVRDAGYTRWDVYSPFPVHGIDEAMGARPTRLAWLILAGGLTGGTLALWMQWWMNGVSYPYIISGKPLFSLPANIPIVFELTILFAAFSAVLGMLGLNRLPHLYHPLFNNPRFKRVTDDRFFIAIEAADPQFDRAKTAELLSTLGASNVEDVKE